MIKSTSSQDDHDEDPGSGADNCGDQEDSTPEATGNQGSLLIDATCSPADIRYPTDLSLLNEAREVTEKLIDAMHPPVRDGFGAKPRTHRRKGICSGGGTGLPKSVISRARSTGDAAECKHPLDVVGQLSEPLPDRAVATTPEQVHHDGP